MKTALSISLGTLEQETDAEGTTSLILDSGHFPLERIDFETSDRNFRRVVSVQAPTDEGGWRTVQQGHLHRYEVGDFREESLSLELAETRAERLRVLVENGANTPVSITGARGEGPVYELFFLAEAGDRPVVPPEIRSKVTHGAGEGKWGRVASVSCGTDPEEPRRPHRRQRLDHRTFSRLHRGAMVDLHAPARCRSRWPHRPCHRFQERRRVRHLAAEPGRRSGEGSFSLADRPHRRCRMDHVTRASRTGWRPVSRLLGSQGSRERDLSRPSFERRAVVWATHPRRGRRRGGDVSRSCPL